MKNLMKAALIVASIATSATLAQAQVLSSTNGTPYNTASINEMNTGAGMAGMKLNVCLSTGCYNETWANLGSATYGVQESGLFRISMGSTADSYASSWRFDLFSTSNLVSVSMSGLAGNTIFDRTNPNTGSPGSSYGLDANLVNQCYQSYVSQNCVSFDHTTVEYSNRVSVNNNFYGDEFETVKFNFANAVLTGPDASGGLDENYTQSCYGHNDTNCSSVGFYLHMDTDKATMSDIKVGTSSVVPEPSTYLLMAAGLGFVGMAAKKKRRVA